jgi:predicted permease
MTWVSHVHDFRHDLRHSVRLLRRAPAFTFVVVCTLGIAIGTTVATFSVTDAWLFRPLRFPNADRLAVAFAAAPTRPSEPAVWMPYRAYLSFTSARTFSSISGAFFQAVTWRTSSDAKSITGMRVTPEFFSTFAVSPLRGRTLNASDAGAQPGVVISYGFWQRALGGAESALGSTVILSEVPYTVVGIMPADFDVRLLDQPEGAAFWSLIRTGERGYTPGGIGPVAIVGRLEGGVTIDAARDDLAAIMRRTESAYDQNFNQFVLTLSSLQTDNARTVRATLLTVMSAALCLLLVAATNVGALLLGRGLGRSGEVAVRHALGADRSRLVRQFLTESLLLSVSGGVFGIALALVAIRLFVAWNPLGTLPANGVGIDGRAMAAAVLAMVTTTVVAGLVPAVRLSWGGPASALAGGGRGNTPAPARGAQRAMLIAQMAVSTVLLVGAALLARTFVQLRAEPLGFADTDLMVAEVVLPMTAFESSSARHAFYNAFEQRIMELPGVRAVAAGTSAPLTSGPPAAVFVTAIDDVAAPRMSAQDVTAGYFGALAIPVIAGRAFDRRDAAQGVPVVILNARAARDLFGGPDRAVGQRIRLDNEPWREVIGVVGNVHTTFFNTLEWRTDPIVYRPAAQALSRMPPASMSFTLWVHIRGARPLLAQEVRDAARAAGPDAAVVSQQRVPDLIASATQQPTFRMTLLLGLCAASLLLAAIGVYGLVAQTVTERWREIAVRIALGADPRAVMATFVKQALATGVIGLVIGIGLALMLARTMESVLYGVRTGDATSLTVAGLLLLLVIGLAAWMSALRAARVEAVQALRA